MSSKNEIVSLSHEQAYDEVAKLDDKDHYSADGAEVYRGTHPEWGPTMIIFPAFGDAIHIPIPAALQPPVTAIKNAEI